MKQSSAGFSLVELLVSLAIIGFTSLLLMSGVGTGRRVWERIEQRTATGESVEAAQTILRDRLEHIFPATRYDSSEPYADLQGIADSFVFFAEPKAVASPAALHRYRIWLTAGGDLTLTSANSITSRVSISELVNLPGPTKGPWDNDVLLRGVQSMEIAYYGILLPDKFASWHPRWTDRPTPPQLVRIKIAFPTNDSRSWPELIVRPATNTDIACVINATTGKCQGRAA